MKSTVSSSVSIRTAEYQTFPHRLDGNFRDRRFAVDTAEDCGDAVSIARSENNDGSVLTR